MIGDPTHRRNAARTRRSGAAAELLRRSNLSAVLERLHVIGPESRSELTAATGLNRSTIADLTAELADLGLVQEGPGQVASGPGRPSALVEARPEGATALAFELAVDSIACATVGLGGHVYNQLRVARPRDRFSPQATVDSLVQLAGPLLDVLPADHVVAGIGAAVVGLVRRSDGCVQFAPNLGWQQVRLAEMLAQQLSCDAPVLVANEADLAALAEFRRGDRPRPDHLLFVSGEVGIGCGVIHGGQPMLGTAGYAGEAGHMLINPHGRPCGCGATGCWETEAGEAALLRHLELPDEPGQLDAIAERAEAGDQATLEAIREVGGWLGRGVGNLVNLFNPDVVVLGGLYQHLFRFLEVPVTEAMATTALPALAELVTVAPSDLDGDAALLGAAELVFSRVIDDPANHGRGRTSQG